MDLGRGEAAEVDKNWWLIFIIITQNHESSNTSVTKVGNEYQYLHAIVAWSRHDDDGGQLEPKRPCYSCDESSEIIMSLYD